MEADAATFGGISSCSFVDQKRQTNGSADFKITSSNKSAGVVFLPQRVSEKALFWREGSSFALEQPICNQLLTRSLHYGFKKPQR
jgi:hypothetical protein